jgi:uncharacterized protein YihD (DUF1040 family)
MAIKEIELKYTVNELVKVMRAKWGKNSDMALAGALSSIITEDQLKALIEGNR